MKRTFAVFSVVCLSLVITVAAIAQAPSTKAKSEQLSKRQLNSLISTAKTPAEHQRIASFYEASAKDYRAQVREHEAMIVAYKSNTSFVQPKEPRQHHRALRILRQVADGTLCQERRTCQPPQGNGRRSSKEVTAHSLRVRRLLSSGHRR